MLEPSKSEVVIAPVELFKEQFAKEAFVKTFVVSEYTIVSPLADNVATAPFNPPAFEPNEPALVDQVGASETVKKFALDKPARPSGFSTLIL